VQATPNEFYTRRLGSFIRGQSKLRDAKAFFGQPQSIERRPDGFIAYYAIRFTTRLKIAVEEANDTTGWV
jgi:hypothetical protein